jgi:ATP-dependent helicase/nuclease subunit A
LWKVKSEWDEAVRRKARDAGREERMREYRRLLYVALTRPRDQLHVCGFRQDRGGSARNWHELVAAAMQRIGATAVVDDDGQQVLRFGSVPSSTEMTDAACPALPLSMGGALPGWVFSPAQVERPDKEILPSEVAERPLGVGYSGHETSAALDLGTAVHKALEAVADARSELWAQRAREAARPHVAAAELANVVAEVLRVRQDPALQFIFGSGSFGEVALRGWVMWQGQRFRFPGRIDRVVVRDTDVLVVEFKTDRFVPTDVAGIRPSYVRQLALYRRALEGLYPGKAVSCGILWTVAARLTMVPVELIEACERVLDPVGTGS